MKYDAQLCVPLAFFGRPIRSSYCHERSICRLYVFHPYATNVDPGYTAAPIEMKVGRQVGLGRSRVVLVAAVLPHWKGQMGR